MPVVDGAAFFATAKLYAPEAKVIVSSVYPLEDQRRMIEGADAYYDKSEGADVLVKKIKNILEHKR